MTTVLRPMSTGEILDRMFSMYRNNFWLFAGISALPPALMLIVNLLMTGIGSAGANAAGGATPVSYIAVAFAGIGIVAGSIAYLVGLAIAHGATIFAVSAVHLGRPITIRESYRRMKGNFGRVVLIMLYIFLLIFAVVFLCAMGLAAVIAAATMTSGRSGVAGSVLAGVFAFLFVLAVGAVAIWLYLRYSLAVAACVLEKLKVRQSIRRSVLLTQGSRMRIFVIYLLLVVLSVGVSMVLVMPITFLMVVSKSPLALTIIQVLQHFASFIVGCLVGPLATIALALVYYDERVRKEAFDIQLMIEALQGPAPAIGISGAGAPVA